VYVYVYVYVYVDGEASVRVACARREWRAKESGGRLTAGGIGELGIGNQVRRECLHGSAFYEVIPSVSQFLIPDS
jgi:hypothetical protein